MKSSRGIANRFALVILWGAVMFSSPAAAQRLITTVVGKDWLPFLEGVQAKDLPLSTQLRHFTLDKQGNLYVPDPSRLSGISDWSGRRRPRGGRQWNQGLYGRWRPGDQRIAERSRLYGSRQRRQSLHR